MTTEEKAKAYDEAIAHAKMLLKTIGNATLGNLVLKNEFKNMFPELAESEDEKIRKALIEMVHDTTGDSLWVDYNVHKEDALAWLEKQGEQPNKVSIWKHWKNGIAGNGEGKLVYLLKSGNTYMLSSGLGFECDYIELSELDKLLSQEKQGEKKPEIVPKFRVGDRIKYITDSADIREIQETDEKKGIYYCENINVLFDEQDDWELVEQKLVEKEFTFKAIPRLLEMIQPSERAKSYCGKLADTLDKEGYHSDANIVKESIKIMNGEKVPMATMDEQKLAWSKEDEKILKEIISDVKFEGYNNDMQANSYKKINWLKSLKPHSTWKPSDEQINALQYILEEYGFDSNKVLKHLLDELKTL